MYDVSNPAGCNKGELYVVFCWFTLET